MTDLGSIPVGHNVTTHGFYTGEAVRLMDIGFVPGTPVTVLRASPLGDPRAYLVRGAVIALRQEDASRVRVSGGDTM